MKRGTVISAAEDFGPTAGDAVYSGATGSVPFNATPKVGERTLSILERRRAAGKPLRRGWVVRRMLLAADLVGLVLAFLAADVLVPGEDGALARGEYLLFLAMLPAWVFAARLHRLYGRDEERTDHSTADDLVGVFHLVTLGVWVFFAGSWLLAFDQPETPRLAAFWALAIALVAAARIAARTLARRMLSYVQNTIIVGAGDVGQLVARKLVQHPEYGINLVGLVDDRPKTWRGDLAHLPLLGSPDQLPELVRRYDVERVVVAFSNDPSERTLALVRALKDTGVQVDIVPRLFELVGPNVGVHTVEGLPLVALPPVRLSRSSRLVKRALDVVGAALLLVVTAPLFAVIAWRVRRDSPGPVFFRQERLGMNMRPFTALKFRTMHVDTPDEDHRAFIRATMTSAALPHAVTGVYKLERRDAVTPVGRWLRRTSLDELPQLLNVLRGDMSLVGPRPCIAYETEHFAPHHFERFLVPAGLTGLWQVTARAHSTFGEALDMDVAYARGWSLGLDLQLLLRTPLQLLRARGTA